MTTTHNDEPSSVANRIACDLHDDVLPALWALSLRAQQVEDALVAGEHSRALALVHDLRRSARATYEQARRLLNAIDVDEAVDDLRHLLLTLSRDRVPAGVHVQTELAALPSFDPAVRREIFLIAREALRNVERHAAATRIFIRSFFDAGYWVLTIEDDGKGIDPDRASAIDGDGFGLRSMRRRAMSVGGVCHIFPGRNGGTTVRLEIPVDLKYWRSD